MCVCVCVSVCVCVCECVCVCVRTYVLVRETLVAVQIHLSRLGPFGIVGQFYYNRPGTAKDKFLMGLSLPNRAPVMQSEL